MHDGVGWRKYFTKNIKCGKCEKLIKSNLNEIEMFEAFFATLINFIIYVIVSNFIEIAYYDSVVLGLPFLIFMHIFLVNKFIEFHE
jgi:hypothetical protein